VGDWSAEEVCMLWSGARARRACSLSLSSLIILSVVSLASLAVAADSLCEPGFVHRPESNLRAIPVARTLDTPPRLVTIQWLGHSSFLIITPGGIAALTDPHSRHVSPTAPDIVTISNENPTHNQAWSVPGNARVLRGRMPNGEWIEVNVTAGDLAIKGLLSPGGNAIDMPVQNNTIFAFRTEGLCIVHLGNLRRSIHEAQRQRLGHPDVLTIPIDGQWTLSYDQVAETLKQLQPAIVLPMHYDFPEHVQLFMQFINEIVPVRTMSETMLQLTRATLPGTTQVIVLGYRGGR
jgi:L-ascorbate metabolism protein UlaG (beta-lactamase superfamily)